MSHKTIVICDECGIEKKECNNWWWLMVYNDRINIGHFETSSIYDEHCCGESCALKAVQRWLATGSLSKNQDAKPIAQWDATGEKP